MLNVVNALSGAAMISLCAGSALGVVVADQPKLSSFFGFEPMRTIVIDRDCGPMIVQDINGDGLADLAVINNSKSRVELYLGRKTPKTVEEMTKDLKVNQLRPTAFYDRKEVSLSGRAGALRAFDVNADGKLDLIVGGTSPAEVTILTQQNDGSFKQTQRHRIKGLQARQSMLRITDVMGDSAPELVVMAEDRVNVFPLNKDGSLGEPRRLGSGGQIAGMLVEDFDGDGLMDIMGVVPEDASPMRLFRQQQDPSSKDKRGLLNSELRFESPAVRDADTARFPGRKAAGLGVIERASRRVVFYDFNASPIEAEKTAEGTISEREANAEVYGFADGNNKDRSVVTIDIDGDGLADLLATDAKTNTLNLYRQRTGVGPGDAEMFSAFKAPKVIAAAGPGAWDEAQTTTVFVMSEEEKAVGVSRYDAQTRKLTFPSPLTLKTAGASPAAMGYVTLDGVGTLAVVVKNKREHTLELHQPSAKGKGEGQGDGITTVDLKGVTRPPSSMLAADVDQDGKTDLLLFTPGEPMVMVRAGEKGEKGKPAVVLTSEQMPQFGLVQAAGPNNTALVDIDNDGKSELLIADKNFVRACRYDEKTGWKVVNQITVSDPGTELVGLTVLPSEGGKPTLVASDRGNGRLLFMDNSSVTRRVRTLGFTAGQIIAGAFAGDKQSGVLCLGDDAFALVRLAGSKLKMESFAAFRSDAAERSEHQIACGDVNGDGALDVVVCDAKDQTCSILTFTSKRNLLLATETKIFETRMFSGGDAREFEPRDAIVADATGDGANDIIFLVHDRVIIYPQMTKPASTADLKPGDR
jgi:hypothetical protein